MVGSVFEFGNKPFSELNKKIRFDIFEAAAKNDLNGLIFTFVYGHPYDDEFIKETIKIVERYKGKVYFVRLYCSNKELAVRVKEDSRKKFGKIKTKKKLKAFLKKWCVLVLMSFVESLEIDNTKISAKKVAKMIKERYGL